MVTRRRPLQKERYILGDLVRHGRERLGYTQQDMAEFLDCSLHWINDIELGKADPTWKDVVHLFILLGINLADFAERAGIKPLEPKKEKRPSLV